MSDDMSDATSRPVEDNSTWETRVSIHHEAVCNLEEVKRAIPILFGPGELHELRPLPSTHSSVITQDCLDGACEAVKSVCDQQVYYSLNPIQLGACRASKKTVTSRRWFLIDVDTLRPDKDTSATDEEKEASGQLVIQIIEYLMGLDWPSPIVIDSGNGWHLLYRIDLPNDPLSQQILKSCLYALAEKFDNNCGIIDRATHDAPRIAKLPGTWARKGLNTPERPYRLCQIIAGENPEVVPVELLQSLGSPPQPTNGKLHEEPWPFTVGRTSGLTAYVKRAIESEGFKVAMSIGGNRNNTLNRAAFCLGTMADWPEMDEQEARSTLLRTGERCGLEPRECLSTIQSGWEAGRLEPRERPVQKSEHGQDDVVLEVPERLVVFGNEVVPKSITWIWQERIAPGFISIFAGKTGIGKSFVLCDVSARLTTGRVLPEECIACDPCNVLFISEDPVEYVLVPRLIALNADLSRIAFMTWEAMDAYTLGDKEMLEKAYIQAGKPKLIIFDPPGNFLGGKDEHRNAEVRSVVMRLVSWLDEHHVAAVFVTHINRRLEKGVEALDRIMGSVAWGTTARIALAFAADPVTQDQCLCAGIKNNLGPKAPTIGYQIVSMNDIAIIEWKGVKDITADEAIGGGRKAPRAKTPWDIAKEWMREFLSNGRRKGDDVTEEGNKMLGENHHVNWWRKAFQEMEGWDIQRAGFGEGSWWSLSRTESENANGANGANEEKQG